MKEEVKIPSVGESIVEGVLSAWLKENGGYVKLNEDLYEFETEKANVTVPSPFEGVLEIIVQEGTKVKIGQVIATIDASAKPAAQKAKTPPAKKEAVQPPVEREPEPESIKPSPGKEKQKEIAPDDLSPSVRRVVKEKEVDISGIAGTGRGGRITKSDIIEQVKEPSGEQEEIPGEKTGDVRQAQPEAGEIQPPEGQVRKVPMSYIRKSIAKHMLAARQEAAHLTTFNEINMENLIDIRRKHQDSFQKKYGIKLGFMSFFVKACVGALKEFPVINARIEGDNIIYYDFYDIGVAISTDRGLLVPVLRSADKLTFAEIEQKISDLAERARKKKIALQELMGGTFSITNGGIFGSLMSTPIPNHPQPAILGMHAVKDRPIAVGGEVKIKPMMYVALTYDHRLIDGREAVSFLSRIKEYIEDPEGLLLNA